MSQNEHDLLYHYLSVVEIILEGIIQRLEKRLLENGIIDKKIAYINVCLLTQKTVAIFN